VSLKEGRIAGLVLRENSGRLAIFSPEGGSAGRTFEIPKGLITDTSKQ
jgi:hypothetical protein